MARAPKIILYSHDTMGLGHMRRNLLIAHAIASSRLQPVILTIVGRPEARRFPLPPRSDRVIVPALRKRVDGAYEPHSLGVSLPELIAVRSAVIASAVEAFDPDLLVVDNVPRGAVRELDSTLAAVSRKGRTKIVLGLRDVLDDPEHVIREWRAADNYRALREWYDAVWVYGDPRVFDSVREYRFAPDIAAKMRYTGYFDQRSRLQFTPAEEFEIIDKLGLRTAKFILCLLGGGQDGAALAETFAEIELPDGMSAVIVAGPYLSHRTLRKLKARAATDDCFRVLEFIAEPAVLISRADRVVMMGGYNTVWEVVSFGRTALVVPRVKPRTEQLIRARRLEEMGLLDVLEPDQLSAVRLSQWAAQLGSARSRITDTVKLNGLETIAQFATEAVGERHRAAAGGEG